MMVVCLMMNQKAFSKSPTLPYINYRTKTLQHYTYVLINMKLKHPTTKARSFSQQ